MHVQIQWPSEAEVDTVTEEVDVDSWWCYLERKIMEGVVFKDILQEKVEALRMAPWIPPASRGRVVNTEHLKCNTSKRQSPPTPVGCPKMLATLICRGTYDPLNLASATITQLKEMCNLVDIPKNLATTKVGMSHKINKILHHI